MYGTHSFCQGGCQYRLHVLGWSPGMTAAWGGWSQQEGVTMFCYFYSPNDAHEHLADYDRKDYDPEGLSWKGKKRAKYF